MLFDNIRLLFIPLALLVLAGGIMFYIFRKKMATMEKRMKNIEDVVTQKSRLLNSLTNDIAYLTSHSQQNGLLNNTESNTNVNSDASVNTNVVASVSTNDDDESDSEGEQSDSEEEQSDSEGEQSDSESEDEDEDEDGKSLPNESTMIHESIQLDNSDTIVVSDNEDDDTMEQITLHIGDSNDETNQNSMTLEEATSGIEEETPTTSGIEEETPTTSGIEEETPTTSGIEMTDFDELMQRLSDNDESDSKDDSETHDDVEFDEDNGTVHGRDESDNDIEKMEFDELRKVPVNRLRKYMESRHPDVDAKQMKKKLIVEFILEHTSS